MWMETSFLSLKEKYRQSVTRQLPGKKENRSTSPDQGHLGERDERFRKPAKRAVSVAA
jgi:hypothetical protein